MRCILFVALAVLVGSASAAERVVVLHGIARSSENMEDLSQYLRQQGYHVINQDYPSTDAKLRHLAELVHYYIKGDIMGSGKVHFVGFSMGGLLVRAIINKYRPPNLGRVVLLATPNGGSEAADFWEGNWLFEKIYGPAGRQLGTGLEQRQHRAELLGEVDYELGVIAGNGSIDPLSSYIIPGDDDGKVSLESAKVEGMRDYIVVPGSHLFFPGNAEVHRQTAHFLEHGYFSRGDGD